MTERKANPHVQQYRSQPRRTSSSWLRLVEIHDNNGFVVLEQIPRGDLRYLFSEHPNFRIPSRKGPENPSTFN